METFLKFGAVMNGNEDRKIDNKIMLEFVKSGYAIEEFVSKVEGRVKERNYIQEEVTYRKTLQRIFGKFSLELRR